MLSLHLHTGTHSYRRDCDTQGRGKVCEARLQSLVSYPAHCSLQRPVMAAIKIGEDTIVILQATVGPLTDGGREREIYIYIHLIEYICSQIHWFVVAT